MNGYLAHQIRVLDIWKFRIDSSSPESRPIGLVINIDNPTGISQRIYTINYAFSINSVKECFGYRFHTRWKEWHLPSYQSISSHLISAAYPSTYVPQFGSGLLTLPPIGAGNEISSFHFSIFISIFGAFKSEQKWNKETHFVKRRGRCDGGGDGGDELLKFLKGEFLFLARSIMGGPRGNKPRCRWQWCMDDNDTSRWPTEGYERKRNSVLLVWYHPQCAFTLPCRSSESPPTKHAKVFFVHLIDDKSIETLFGSIRMQWVILTL